MRLVKLSIMLPIALLILTPAHATTPTLVAGIYFPNRPGTVTGVQTADDNIFAILTRPFTFTGGIQGVGVFFESFTLHTSTGQIFDRGQIAFTGTVMGSQPGSAVVLFEGTGTVFPLPFGSIQVNLVLGGGTDGLANIRGEGTLQVEGGHGTYSVLVHFDPA